MAKKERLPQKRDRRRRRLIDVWERITEPWRQAIFKLRNQLADECLSQKAECRRLKQRRLIENFIEIGPATVAPRNSMMSYWLFCGSPWQDQLGYNGARQQHYAELKSLGFSRHFQPNTRDFVDEFIFRLDSLA